MAHTHNYRVDVEWTGNKGSGTFDYRSYSRSHLIKVDGKPQIYASSDSKFRGEIDKHNPEDLFVASISGCHMLWYLHLCADQGVIVLKYEDHAEGSMIINPGGDGFFERVVLKPSIIISPESSAEMAESLHEDAHKKCFIANSCNFPILCLPEISK